MSCENGEHNAVVKDAFSTEIKSVIRYTPGDCYCRDCKEPIAAWWNNGSPKAIPAGTLDED